MRKQTKNHEILHEILHEIFHLDFVTRFNGILRDQCLPESS